MTGFIKCCPKFWGSIFYVPGPIMLCIFCGDGTVQLHRVMKHRKKHHNGYAIVHDTIRAKAQFRYRVFVSAL